MLQRFYTLIREVFVAMYKNSDPLGDLARAYDLPDPPKCGDLDLMQVLSSPYFFS
jgi:DNA-directed RNA polymerase